MIRKERSRNTNDFALLQRNLGFRISRGFKRPRITHNLHQTPRQETKSSVTVDHISSLPDSILQQILSLLPVKYAIRTRELSKRWYSVWTQVPVLNFSNCSRPCSVDEALRLHRAPKVEKLYIGLQYAKFFSSMVDEWIGFAAERNVEDLSLDFYGDRYHVHESIFTNSSLKVLHIRMCSFKLSGYVSWTSLKVLSIGFAKLNNQVIKKILLGSPKLEYLKLYNCKGDDRMVVSSSNLKELVLKSVEVHGLRGRGESKGTIMEIWGPNIRSLSLFGLMDGRIFRLVNRSSLVEANLGFEGYINRRNLLVQLLGELSHVQKLTIGERCVKNLLTCDVEILPSPSSKLKSLIVDTSVIRSHLQAIGNLLQSFPLLEKLVLNMKVDSTHEDEVEASKKRDLIIFEANHLKSVEVTGFGCECIAFKFQTFCNMVKSLLKNATTLEKMIIYAETEASRGLQKMSMNFHKESQLILSYPRASANAVVVFESTTKLW